MSRYAPLPSGDDAEIPLRGFTSEDWALQDDAQLELEPGIPSTHRPPSIPLMSLTVEQRRRKWWRDGVINVMFMSSW